MQAASCVHTCPICGTSPMETLKSRANLRDGPTTTTTIIFPPNPRSRALAHRYRSDFCDLRLRCPSRTQEIARFPKQETAMMHCDLRVRWKVASDLRFRAAISEPKTPSCCGISGDLAPSTRKSLAIAIVRFWCAKQRAQ